MRYAAYIKIVRNYTFLIFVIGFVLLSVFMAFTPKTHALGSLMDVPSLSGLAATPPQDTQIDLKPVKNGGVEANGSTINSVKNIVFGLAGSLAFLFIVIGGVRYILSRGDPNATAQAKNTIIYALVGLIVTILAYAIVGFVLGSI